MTFREDNLGENLMEATELINQNTRWVHEHLGDINHSVLRALQEQLDEVRDSLDKLAYAITTTSPLADLNDQIAQSNAADRLAAERDRVRAKRAP